MTPDDLRKIMPYSAGKVDLFAQPLNDAMAQFEINTARRRAAFIAQVAHESGELHWLRELASGAAYEPARPGAPVNERAKELGNIYPGDGPKYRGGGLLQITGRTQYLACGKELGVDLVAQPDLVETPAIAAKSAAWFWSVRGLNELADTDHFGEITRRINGGYNGLDERLFYWLEARKVEGL